MHKYLVIALLLLIPQIANATTGTYTAVVSGLFVDDSTTVGTTAKQVVPGTQLRKYLIIQNVGTVNIGCSYAATPVIGSASTVTLVPNASWVFETSFIFSGPVYCVAASGTTNPVTAFEGY